MDYEVELSTTKLTGNLILRAAVKLVYFKSILFQSFYQKKMIRWQKNKRETEGQSPSSYRNPTKGGLWKSVSSAQVYLFVVCLTF